MALVDVMTFLCASPSVDQMSLDSMDFSETLENIIKGWYLLQVGVPLYGNMVSVSDYV